MMEVHFIADYQAYLSPGNHSSCCTFFSETSTEAMAATPSKVQRLTEYLTVYICESQVRVQTK